MSALTPPAPPRLTPPRVSALRRRMELLWALRSFFRAEGVHEAEPPTVVSCPGMEPHLDAFEVVARHATPTWAPEGARRRRYLHTSPELALKRLLGEGFERLYALRPVFRDELPSRTHNPEFTMLEWYLRGEGLGGLMDQCERLITRLAGEARGLLDPAAPPATLTTCLSAPFERLSVREAFLRYAHIDLDAAVTAAQLRAAALTAGVRPSALEGEPSWDEVYFQVFLDLIEPHLGRGRPTFLYDFPASQSALARLRPDAPRWALRCELFVEGLELANAFDELSNPTEQRARFESERAARAALGKPAYPIDEALLDALPRMGACVGVALGFDRLVMLLLGLDHIAEGLPQGWDEL
jgi:lysyl-tRNA synthetase class 2